MSLPGCHLLFSEPGKLLLICSKSAEVSSSLCSLLRLWNRSGHVFHQPGFVHTAHPSPMAQMTFYLNCFAPWMVLNLSAHRGFRGGMRGGSSWREDVPCGEGQRSPEWRNTRCKLFHQLPQCYFGGNVYLLLNVSVALTATWGEKSHKTQTPETLVLILLLPLSGWVMS